MKVIIAGAGIGGIYAGERLGELGFEVVVYEKAKSVKEMRFDWHDVVSPKIFRRLGLPIPSEHFKVLPYSFVTPYEKFIKRLPAGDPDPDISLERVPLNEMLYNHAKAYAKFEFGKTVTAPIVKDNRVVGVVVDGKEEYADFVLDSAGIYSPVRKNLPKEFNITEIKDEERFSAYRAFYNRADVPEPEHTNKAYLKHFGGKGLSWVLLDDDTSKVNVLIGRLDSLNDSEREELLADLKANNPIIGEGITRGGFTTLIPLRYPATRFVANGYAGIGDTAYMTIPMKGSGIASGLISAHLLWETLKEAMDKGENSPNIFNIETLWNYQVKCYMEFGAKHCAVDIMKRWLMEVDPDFITWAFQKGIMSDNELKSMQGGQKLKITAKSLIQKVLSAGLFKLPALLGVAKVAGNARKAESHAKTIPLKFNEEKIAVWEKKLEKFFIK